MNEDLSTNLIKQSMDRLKTKGDDHFNFGQIVLFILENVSNPVGDIYADTHDAPVVSVPRLFISVDKFVETITDRFFKEEGVNAAEYYYEDIFQTAHNRMYSRSNFNVKQFVGLSHSIRKTLSLQNDAITKAKNSQAVIDRLIEVMSYVGIFIDSLKTSELGAGNLDAGLAHAKSIMSDIGQDLVKYMSENSVSAASNDDKTGILSLLAAIRQFAETGTIDGDNLKKLRSEIKKSDGAIPSSSSASSAAVAFTYSASSQETGGSEPLAAQSTAGVLDIKKELSPFSASGQMQQQVSPSKKPRKPRTKKEKPALQPSQETPSQTVTSSDESGKVIKKRKNAKKSSGSEDLQTKSAGSPTTPVKTETPVKQENPDDDEQRSADFSDVFGDFNGDDD